MSNSVRPHRRQPTRLLHSWDSPGKNTGVGCHFLLQCMKVESESEVTQSRPTLRDPMDSSLPGSSVHGIFQARVLEWGAIAFSTNSHWLTPIHDYWEDHSFCYMAFVCRVMSLLLDMFSRFLMAFFPRYKCLLLLWLQSPSAVILKPPNKRNQPLLLLFPLLFAIKWGGQMPRLVSFMLSLKPTFSFSFHTHQETLKLPLTFW